MTGKTVQVPGDMTYREWYEQYVSGDERALANERKIQNQSSDKRQYAEYQQILGEKAPKTFADFQQMKYTDSEAWDALKLAQRDAQLQADIRAGRYDLTINPEKQARHIMGADGYIPGRSYLTIVEDELQELVKQYAGTGEILHGGRSGVRELIQTSKILGYDVSPVDSTATETNRAILYYSSSGVHLVPTLRKFRREAQL